MEHERTSNGIWVRSPRSKQDSDPLSFHQVPKERQDLARRGGIQLSGRLVRRSGSTTSRAFSVQRIRVQSPQDFVNMQPRLSFDRMLLILIAVGVVSILGVGWIFLTADSGKSRTPPTATPSRLRSLRAGMLTAAQSPSATLTREESPLTETGPDAYPRLPTETLSPTSTLVTESLPTPSATFTPDRIQPLAARTYDDMDPNIAYDGSWTVLKNPGTKNAYRGTLHVSTAIGSEASFRFKGERFRLGYQRGKNFGIVTVMIDDQSHTFHEEAFDLVWLSPQLPAGDHFVRIIHESGQSINLDYVEILY